MTNPTTPTPTPAGQAVEDAELEILYRAVCGAHAFCPTDMPHLDRMRWQAKHIQTALRAELAALPAQPGQAEPVALVAEIAQLCRTFLDAPFGKYDARATVTRLLKLATATPPAPVPASPFPGWSHWQERIKALMATTPMPESMSVYGAMSQLCNEMGQAASPVVAPVGDMSGEEQQCHAWFAVVNALQKINPDFLVGPGTGAERAILEIERLAASRVPVAARNQGDSDDLAVAGTKGVQGVAFAEVLGDGCYRICSEADADSVLVRLSQWRKLAVPLGVWEFTNEQLADMVPDGFVVTEADGERRTAMTLPQIRQFAANVLAASPVPVASVAVKSDEDVIALARMASSENHYSGGRCVRMEFTPSNILSFVRALASPAPDGCDVGARSQGDSDDLAVAETKGVQGVGPVAYRARLRKKMSDGKPGEWSLLHDLPDLDKATFDVEKLYTTLSASVPAGGEVPEKYLSTVAEHLMKLVTRACAEFHDYSGLRNNWTGGEALKARRAYRATLDEIENGLRLLATQPPGPQDAAPAVAVEAAGMVLAPHYRGYANLGTGQYVLNHTGELPAELIISIATEEEKAGRAVGDSRYLEPRKILHPEDMAVRLRFENVAGLDALEQQLRLLREELFPNSAATPPVVQPTPGQDAKDVRRYQWLREHSDSMSLNPPLTVAKVTGWGLEGWSGDDLDSAIDAAIQASEPASPAKDAKP